MNYSPDRIQKLQKTISFRLSYLLPKYWPTWALFFFLWVIHWLPRKCIMRIGSWIGDQIKLRNQKRRKIVELNLKLCFPFLNQEKRHQLLIAHYRIFGAALVDLGTIWWSSSNKLDQIIMHRNKNRYTELINTKKQIIFFTPHCVAIDAGGVAISKMNRMVSMMNRDKNPLITRRLYRSRTRFNTPLLLMRDQGLRHLISGIRAGLIGYYLPDGDFGETQYTRFVSFFGIQTSTLTALGRICRLCHSIAVPCMTTLNIHTGDYEFFHGKPMDGFPTGSLIKDTERMNKALEEMIRLSPAQYMWTYKWFKTRPNGEESPYV